MFSVFTWSVAWAHPLPSLEDFIVPDQQLPQQQQQPQHQQQADWFADFQPIHDSQPALGNLVQVSPSPPPPPPVEEVVVNTPQLVPATPDGPHIVPTAIHSSHQVNYHDVINTGHIEPTLIDVPANILPIHFVFRSASSMVNVEAKHESAKGSVQETHSQDGPHRVIHHIHKPIINEVHEMITPYRKITQTVEPLKETVQTLVARGVAAKAGLGTGTTGAVGALEDAKASVAIAEPKTVEIVPKAKTIAPFNFAKFVEPVKTDVHHEAVNEHLMSERLLKYLLYKLANQHSPHFIKSALDIATDASSPAKTSVRQHKVSSFKPFKYHH